MWFLRNPERLKAEVESIDALRNGNAWLASTTNQVQKGLKFVVEFDLVVNGETLPFSLEYPSFFPETPPSVMPRDGRRHSNHQYGTGGELCLEYRPDNWDPSVTGAMMIESTHRLLSGEQPSADARAAVPSAHKATLGQQLRGTWCRFLFTPKLHAVASEMEVNTAQQCKISEIIGPNKTWTAFISAIGDTEKPIWQEPSIPAIKEGALAGIFLRVASLPEIALPNQQAIDDLISATPGAQPALDLGDDVSRFTVVTDGTDAQAYFSYTLNSERRVLHYKTIDLRDNEARVPSSYAALRSKRVGIVGAGSLGSKIAASLTRNGVGSFVLVDDDVLMPGNLKRHELDVRGLGAHKVDGLEERLRAIAPSLDIGARRVDLGGQEASGTTATVLDELGTCDLLIDATADPQAFNFVASVARNALIPMIWAEVYAGGLGGFVGRVRPTVDPPPHSARRQYWTWCREQGVPWTGDDRQYESRRDTAPPVIADDSDVSVIAAHASRMATDVLVSPNCSAFPHAAYVIGLVAGWIFAEPFDTRPIDFVPEGKWREEASDAQVEAAIGYVASLLDPTSNAH